MMRHFALAPFALLLFILPFPGTVALRLLCLSIAFVVAVASWKKLAPPSLPLPLKAALALWAILAFASLSYAVDPAYSLGEIKNELGYSMMAFVAFFAISDDERRVRWLWLALWMGALLLCFAALAARFTLGSWDDALWFGGIAAYASYLAVMVPLVVLSGFFANERGLRCAVFLMLPVLLVTGLFSGQRIIWPVLFLQACIALAFFRKTLGLGFARIAAMLVILALAAVTAFFSVQGTRFHSYNWEQPPIPRIGNDDRTTFWPVVVARILEKPLTGAGFGRGAMKKAYPDLTPRINRELWHPHNLVLNYGVAMGLPGMAAITLVFACLLWQYGVFWGAADRRLKLIGACGMALVLGVFARNMVNDLFLRDGALLFWGVNGSLLGIGLRLKAAQQRQVERGAHV